nr:hypothetical protein [Escherichia coli]
MMILIDSINHSGKGSVWFAGQGIKEASMVGRSE